MKILLSCDFPFHQSGLSVLAESCYKGLTELGHEVIPHSLFDFMGTDLLLTGTKFDVSLGIGYWNDAPTQIALPKRYNVPTCVWYVSEASVPKYQDIVSKADLLLTTSNYSTKVFQRDVPESRPKTLYIGTDVDFYKPNPEIEVKRGFATFISSGEIKGAEEALTAVKFLKDKNLQYSYIVHSPFAKEYKLEKDFMLRLQNLVAKHKLEKWTSLVAGLKIPVEKMPWIYQSMFAYLAPLRMACFGIPLIEAGACGTPSICGNWEPMSEIIEDGKTGILIPHMAKGISPKFQEGLWYTEEYKMIDTTILAEKMEWLLNNPEERNKMGQNARKLVEERFNSKKQIKILEQELLKL